MLFEGNDSPRTEEKIVAWYYKKWMRNVSYVIAREGFVALVETDVMQAR